MKELTSATFRDTFMDLDEPVQVRRYNTVLGTWYPQGAMLRMGEVVDESIRKAIEPEKVKKDPRGRPTKGLGEIPGLQRNPYEEFRPAPKPGKSK